MYEAMNVYSALVHSKQSNQLPCDFKDIRKCYETALDQEIGQFQVERSEYPLLQPRGTWTNWR